MNNERKAPILCLKTGVNACLYNGEKKILNLAPKTENGSLLIPSEALTLVGIITDGDYVDYDLISGLYKSKNDMGLIFISDNEADVDLSLKSDLKYMLSLTHAFIFEMPRVTISESGTYAPATEKEREGFITVGNYVLDILKKRNNAHPFIFANQGTFDKLREIYLSQDNSTEYKSLCKLVEDAKSRMKEHFPDVNDENTGFKSPFPSSGYGETEYDVGGRHTESEYRMRHLVSVAFAHNITSDDYMAYMSYYSAVEILNRKHWGPGHFLNCSGCTGYLATVYDWMYNSWTRLGLDTGKIRRGIYDQGILHGYNSVIHDSCIFPSPKQGTGWRFKLKPDNWNSVCNSGMVLGALCLLNDGIDNVITQDEYNNTTELLGASITSLTQPNLVYTQYAPDGSYVESNSYWDYGTTNLLKVMGALYTALGTDLGMHHGCGLDKTCYYAINSESADFVGWNYHDGSLSRQNTGIFNLFATISNDHLLYSLRKVHLERGKEEYLEDMLFSPRVLGITPPELGDLPLDYAMIGIDAFVVRDGWKAGSLYAGMMGGENPDGGSHNQLDSGSFVYHNYGKMWFTDMGSDYYNVPANKQGQGYFSNYGLYRRGAEGNNTLCLKSLPYGQKLGGRGDMIEYKSSPTASYCIIDNKSVYGEELVVSAKRGMLLTNERKTLVIKDEVEFTGEETAFWIGHYESDKITVTLSDDSKSCVMTHSDGTKLDVAILSDDGKFEIMNCYSYLLDGTESVEGEYSREKHSRLVIKLENTKKTNLCVAIGDTAGVGNLAMEMWKTL